MPMPPRSIKAMLFILYSTGRCNLSCSYCGGSFDERVVPWSVEYSLEYLGNLIGPRDVVAFYGGEPLLNIEFVENAMEQVAAGRWVVQTNGLLLHLLRNPYLERMDAVLVSIDGGPEITDRNRGEGVYRKVVENVKKIRAAGYSGDVVARMTVTEEGDIYRDVRHLLSLGLFDHIHWQLSLVWTSRWRDLWGWIERYKAGLSRLMDHWIERIREGDLAGIVPFQGVLKRMIEGGPAPPCGAGTTSFTVLTDGRIVSCPIAVSESWAHVGHVKEISRSDLENRRSSIGEPCTYCEYFTTCGGRCLYTHIERLWGPEGMEAVCTCSRYLIDLVKSNLDRIMDAASDAGFRIEELAYPEYDNTVEIMP